MKDHKGDVWSAGKIKRRRQAGAQTCSLNALGSSQEPHRLAVALGEAVGEFSLGVESPARPSSGA